MIPVQSLKPIWKGPHPMILIISTAVKMANVIPWSHTQLKEATKADRWVIAKSFYPIKIAVRWMGP